MLVSAKLLITFRHFQVLFFLEKLHRSNVGKVLVQPLEQVIRGPNQNIMQGVWRIPRKSWTISSPPAWLWHYFDGLIDDIKEVRRLNFPLLASLLQPLQVVPWEVVFDGVDGSRRPNHPLSLLQYLVNVNHYSAENIITLLVRFPCASYLQPVQ